MVWGSRPRKPTADDSVVGLDINAGRARATVSVSGLPPRPARLMESNEELPLALALDHRPPLVGISALAHRRRSPHLLCAGFLPLLNEPRTWQNARNKIDATAALTVVGETIRNAVAGARTVYVTLPAYLTPLQVQKARGALEAASLPIAGSCALPLALAAGAEARRGSILVLDADDHAATWTLLNLDAKQVRVANSMSLSNLGVRAWVDRLMESVADRCIRLCRRDPRDSASAEQSIEEQLVNFLEQPRPNQSLTLSIRTEHWFQNLLFAPEDVDRTCSNLARSVADGLRSLLATSATPPEALWITASAARLPALAETVGVRLPERTHMEELAAAASADAAHALAIRRSRGEFPAGHLDVALPLPASNDRVHVRS